MNWNYSLTTVEYSFLGSFLLLYAAYFYRTLRLARLMNTTAWATIPKFFLRVGYLLLLLIALLGPSFGEAERALVAEGKDIFLAVDLSRSMDAPDVPPTRLDKVKFELHRLISAMEGSRFGLLVFSTEAYVHAPLTSDQTALAAFLQSLDTRLVPESGTNICSAVELGLQKHLKETGTTNQTRVIVLLTDGENFGNCSPRVTDQLRRANIPLYVVGVGSDLGSTVPGPKGALRDAEGKIVRSRLNRTYLRRLAQDGRGAYVELSSASGDLTELVTLLKSLEDRLVDQRQLPVASNKYYYFLIGAFILMIIDLIVPVRTIKI